MLVGLQKQPELHLRGCLQVPCREDFQAEFLGSRVRCQRCAVRPYTAQGRQENLLSLSARWREGVAASSNLSTLGPETAVLAPGLASDAQGL